MMLVIPLAITWFAMVGLALLDGRRCWVGWAAVAVLASSLVGIIVLLVVVLQTGPVATTAGEWPEGIGITLRADALGVTFAVLSVSVLLISLCYEVMSGIESRTFPALVLAMATGMIGLFLTADFFNFYVFFEISMVAAYVLTGYGERPNQLRAATIFLTVNLLGSVLFLIAIAALYHLTGTLDMLQLAARIPIVQVNPSILSATLIFVAFGVKLGLFPFHFWLAAVYTGTSPAVAAILSGALANIGSYGLLRFGGDLLPRELEQAAPVLLILGGASILYGGLQAVSCGDSREVVAYSSIGQVGYILVALAIGHHIGYSAAVLFAVTNAINKTLLFLTLPLRGRLIGTALAIGSFGVVGLPPAAGFIGKASVFRASLAEANVVLVSVLFLGSALSFIYMFQMYGRAFWTIKSEEMASPWNLRLVVIGLAMVSLTLGIWPEPLLALSEHAANVLPGRAQ
jgi:multicomponent Na+:H+ antiporter subunit D